MTVQYDPDVKVSLSNSTRHSHCSTAVAYYVKASSLSEVTLSLCFK